MERFVRSVARAPSAGATRVAAAPRNAVLRAGRLWSWQFPVDRADEDACILHTRGMDCWGFAGGPTVLDGT